jgi:hypothetical protein
VLDGKEEENIEVCFYLENRIEWADGPKAKKKAVTSTAEVIAFPWKKEAGNKESGVYPSYRYGDNVFTPIETI